jgi:tetratricopeptide (TPR) repeat protein
MICRDHETEATTVGFSKHSLPNAPGRNRVLGSQGVPAIHRDSGTRQPPRPANSGLLLDLGRAYGKRHDYAAAERCLEKAIRVAPQKTETLAIAGQQCRDFGSYEMAERYFQRALEHKDASPETFVKLAELCESFRRPEDAAQLINRALHLNGACPEALLARARLRRLDGRLDEAQRLLRLLLTKCEPALRVPAWYELGGVPLDRQGRHDDAMAAFLEAKVLLRSYASPRIPRNFESVVHA